MRTRGLIAIGAAVVLIIGVVAGTALAQGPGGMMDGWGRSGWGHRGMMGTYGSEGWETGMWGRGQIMRGFGGEGWGSGMWGRGSMMSGCDEEGCAPGAWGQGQMMDGYGDENCPMWGPQAAIDGEPISLDKAWEIAEEAAASYDNRGQSEALEVAEVMQFSRNFYAVVRESDTGVGAFELLIDPYTGAVHPEPGPNMMWNTKYGHMGAGMMGGRFGRGRSSGPMTVSAAEAQASAQQWLDANLPGAAADDEIDTFYGYYTLHTLEDGTITGMLSVNGHTGQVWYHSWHGDFVAMAGEHAE